jgi:hypothetical protein
MVAGGKPGADNSNANALHDYAVDFINRKDRKDRKANPQERSQLASRVGRGKDTALLLGTTAKS